MRRTILDTPVLTALLRPLAALVLRLSGWKARGNKPDTRRYVMIAAPHTSNLDGVYLLLMAAVLRIKLFWIGKHTLFRFPFGGLMRWFGGIAVDRRHSSNLVERLGDLFKSEQDLVIVIPPEATRSRSRRWKTGFYYIAVAGEVPIGLGYLDWGKKEGGVGPMFEPSGDIDSDMPRIRAFYEGKRGRNPADFGDISLGDA